MGAIQNSRLSISVEISPLYKIRHEYNHFPQNENSFSQAEVTKIYLK